MNFEQYITPENIYISTFILCFISGFIPIVNAEAIVIGVAAMSEDNIVWQVGFVAALGQMLAKGMLFYAGRGVIKIPMGKYEAKLAEVEEKFQKWQGRSDAFIFLSASVGFPPFYVVSILAGMLKLNFARFFASGLAGRFIRFGLLALFPQLLRGSL
ncbi:MAG: VTT domain-containing protein [Deferribacteres bacterium]|nr:VTT domain-containing protein [candidate division KSB1 bacterium]MCB9502538.1 VTT domain-containing protein [Deferribacteres bacterium]